MQTPIISPLNTIDGIDPRTTTIGVVGAGNMGSGIAQKYATEGFNVVVVDLNDEAAQRGFGRVDTMLQQGVERRVFSPEKKQAILDRMTFTADMTALKDAALVIEAVFENKKVKQELFQKLDGICGPETILATNTSSFYVKDLIEGVGRPDKVVGLHYFFHPAKNRLVEVIGHEGTSQAAYDMAWALQEMSGKTPIVSEDAPGFVVNRFFVPWLNESLRIVEEGVADIATVEAATKQGFGVGMGPFELMNVTGVPITLHAATTLGEELGPFYAPCDFIRPVVEAKENWDLSGTPDETKFDAVNDRLMGAVFQIAVQMVFEENVCSAEDCDLGARVGLRWPKGPFEMMNTMGTEKALALVEAIAARYDDVKVPSTIEVLGIANNPFDLTLVQTREDDGVGYLTFNRPDAMNALNETVVAQAMEGFARLDADENVKGIVVEGKGKAFIAGADTKFFVEQIKADDLPRIGAFGQAGQDLLRAFETSAKPVICKLDGLSLGGGSELALACDQIIATPAGTVGFPETGIGIYPGLGGTQRTPRRVGVALGRWLVLSGQVLGAKQALAAGLIDAVVSPAELGKAVRDAALSGQKRAEVAPPTTVPAGFEGVAAVFENDLDALLAGTVEIADEKLAKTVSRMKHKAPLAMKAADGLVRAAANNTLEAGLADEMAQMVGIFATADALEGLSSMGKRRPTFTGA